MCELQKRTPSDEISSDNPDDDDLDSSRLENLHWCRCKNHRVIPHALIERREYENLLKALNFKTLIASPNMKNLKLSQQQSPTQS